MNPLIRAMALTFVGTASALGVLPAQEKVLSKQEQATRLFEKLTERMQTLRITLKNTDPEKAKVLGLGATFIQEKAIASEMKTIQEYLGEESWDEAIERCQRVVKDLNTLIELLLKGDKRIEDILKDIERLKAFKEKVEKLIAEEKAQKDESARAEALAQHVKNLEKAKQDLEDLIADQKDVRDQANNAGLQAEPNKAENMAKKEDGLKDRAEKLAKDIDSLDQDAKDIAEMKAAEGKPGEGKPGEGKPGDAKPGDAKPGEAKPGDAKPGEAKPGDAKPGEAKPGEGKPGEGKPGEGKPGEGQPGDGEAGDGKSPKSKSKGASAASGASQDMDKAAGKLQDNRPESSLEDMDKAIEKLDAAKKELEKQIEDAKRELLKLPFELLAKKQEQTKIETDKLAEEMEKSESESGEGQGKPTPGKQNVQQSVPKMKSAAGSLKEYKPGKAKQDQQDAQDALEKAQKALDDALAQLRQQLQDEVLRSLEERFGEMLAKQKKISAKTRLIEAQKGESLTANGSVSTALKKRTGIQAVGELELSTEAHNSLKLLEEDGTTAVFPDFIIEVREDLKKVAKRLNAQKTGKATQTMQKEIEDMLEMLIDALRQQIEQNESNGGEP